MEVSGSAMGHNRRVEWRRVAIGGLLMAVTALAACSTSPPSPQARATAEACSVFSGHADTSEIEMAAIEGQRSGDGDLAQAATQLRKNLAQAYPGVSALVEVKDMAERCDKLGFHIAQGW
jgi:hypothetical protein